MLETESRDAMDWIERLKIIAHDPERAVSAWTDPRVTDANGNRYFPTANPVVTLEEIQEFESKSGVTLPADMRRVYLEVGNGRFGPAYGLDKLGGILEDFQRLVNENSYLELYGRPWNSFILPILGGGCDLSGVLDVQNGRIGTVNYEILEGESLESIIEWVAPSLQAWLELWMDGTTLFGYSEEFMENSLNPLFKKHEALETRGA
jgi:hypothetical protein